MEQRVPIWPARAGCHHTMGHWSLPEWSSRTVLKEPHRQSDQRQERQSTIPSRAVDQGRLLLNSKGRVLLGTNRGQTNIPFFISSKNSIPFSILLKVVCFSLDAQSKEFRILAVSRL